MNLVKKVLRYVGWTIWMLFCVLAYVVSTIVMFVTTFRKEPVIGQVYAFTSHLHAMDMYWYAMAGLESLPRHDTWADKEFKKILGVD